MIEQYAYTGDVKKLKTIGFTFQKLYAANYKTYMNNYMIMYVISKMVLEIDRVNPKHQAAYVAFILENKDKPKEFWVSDHVFGQNNEHTFKDMANFHFTHFGNVVTNKELTKLRHVAWDCIKYGDDVPEEEKEANHARMMECEGGRDPYRFDLTIVNEIIALDNLHPLEIIENNY